MSEKLIELLDDELAHKGRLLPGTQNATHRANFVCKLKELVDVQDLVGSAPFTCLLRVIGETIRGITEAQEVYPRLLQLLPYLRKGDVFQLYCAVKKVIYTKASDKTVEYGQSIFVTTADQKIIRETERQRHREKKQARCLVRTLLQICMNVKRGLVGNFDEQVLALCTACGARGIEIMSPSVSMFTAVVDRPNEVTQTGVAKKKTHGKHFQTTKLLVGCSFEEFATALTAVRQHVAGAHEAGYDNAKLQNRYGCSDISAEQSGQLRLTCRCTHNTAHTTAHSIIEKSWVITQISQITMS